MSSTDTRHARPRIGFISGSATGAPESVTLRELAEEAGEALRQRFEATDKTLLNLATYCRQLGARVNELTAAVNALGARLAGLEGRPGAAPTVTLSVPPEAFKLTLPPRQVKKSISYDDFGRPAAIIETETGREQGG
jgi:hypothetical protein